MKSLSIKTRISLMAVVACLLLVGCGTAVQLHVLRSDYAKVLADQQLALATQIGNDVDDKFQSGLSLLGAAGRSLPADLLDNPQDGGARLRDHLRKRPFLPLFFDELLVLDRQGAVIADRPALAGRQSVSLADQPWFGRVMTTGLPAVGDPMMAPARAEPIVPLAAPLRGADGRIRAVLVGVLRLRGENFLSRLTSAQVGRKGYLSLMTKGEPSVYVMHPQPERILQRRPALANPRTTLALKGEDGTAEGTNSRGLHALYAYRSLKSVDWLLVSALPTDEAFEPIRRAEQRALVMGVILVLVITPLCWLLLNRLLKPLSDLRSAIRRLHRSDDDFVEVPVRRQDEIGELSRAFNQLIHERQTRAAEFQAMNDASPLGIFRSDLSGYQDYANRTLERMLGVGPDELLGDAWFKALYEPDRERVTRQWHEALVAKVQYNNLQRIVRTDGQVRWLSVSATPIVVHGEVVGHVGTVEDVTERRESDEARRMLAAILESSPDFVAMTDVRGRIRYVNPAGLRVRGIDSLEAARGTTIEQHFPAAVVRRLFDEALPTATARGSWSGQTAIWDASRREVPIHHVVLVGRTADGEVEFYASVMRDITAELRAERSLRESEMHMRTITDNVPALVSYVDTEHRFRFANRAYREWFGLDPSEILGRSVLELFGEDLHRLVRPFFDRAIGGETVEYEREIRIFNQVRQVHVTKIPDRNESGEVVGVHVVLTDVTDKKNEERRLRELSQYDPLTGLLNRAGFDRSLREAMQRCQITRELMGLMYVDIDRFKSINDTYGHVTGDAILRAFAQRVNLALRSGDLVCRIGGDEFTLIVERIGHSEHAATIAEKIVDAMREPFEIAGRRVVATASIGIAFYDGDGSSAEDLLRRADEALYLTKHAGRDSFRLASFRSV